MSARNGSLTKDCPYGDQHRQLVELAEKNGAEMAIVRDIRLLPSEDRRHVEVYALLIDGGEVAVEYDLPCDPVTFDEAEERDRFLFMPSGALH